MNIKVKKEGLVDVKYICANLGVRYWEDASVNGVDDISYEEQENGAKPRIPLAVEDENAKHPGDKYRWVIKINVETGNVDGWEEGVKADVHYKVCDDGTYWMEDDRGNKIHEIDSYVPDLFDFCNDSYGDYIIMTIGEDGHIEEWYDEHTLKQKLDGFMQERGF